MPDERNVSYDRDFRPFTPFRVTLGGNRATQATVVPAKAGIQEIPRKRAIRLQNILDSGFRRNDGFMRRPRPRPA